MKTIKREDFLNALKLIMPAAGAGGLGGPDLVVFDNGWVRGYNDNLSISYKFDTGIEGAVPVEELFKTLKILKTNTVEVTPAEDWVEFKCGITTLRIVKIVGTECKMMNQCEDYTRLKNRLASLNLKKAEWVPMPKNLLEGLKLSLMAAEDSAIGRLTGIVIVDSIILSSDNYRLAKYDMGETISDDPIRLKTSAVSNLVRMKKTFDFVGVAERWLHLKKDDLIVSIGQIPYADYPLEDVTDVFNGWFDDPTVYTMPAGLEKYIKRTELLAGIGGGIGDDYHHELNFATAINLKTDGGHLVITAGKNVGMVEIRVPWDGTLPNLTIAPAFLKQVLRLTRSFRVSQDKKMVLFETPNFKILTVAKAETALQVTEEGGD
jgi:hypothetical protein